MSRNTRTILLFAVAAVALAALTGPAAALNTTQPADSNVAPSDLNDTATVDGFNANSDGYSLLELKTDSANTTDALTVEITAEDNIHASYDTLDESYSATTGVDTTGDSSTDSDVHTFNISHSDLETVPVTANGETPVTIDVTHEYTSGSTSYTDTLSFDATLNATEDRTVIFITEDNVDSDSTGGSVSTSDVEPSIWDEYINNASASTQYDLDDELTVAGSNTTITMYFNGDVADEYEGAVRDDIESSDLVLGQTLLVDESAKMNFYEEMDSDLANDSATYGVYNPSADSLTVEIGDSHSDATSLPVRAVSNDAGELELESSALSAYTNADIGVLTSSLGYLTGLDVWFSGLSFMGMVPLIVVGGRRSVAE